MDEWIADDGDEMVKDSGKIRILRYCPRGIFFYIYHIDVSFELSISLWYGIFGRDGCIHEWWIFGCQDS